MDSLQKVREPELRVCTQLVHLSRTRNPIWGLKSLLAFPDVALARLTGHRKKTTSSKQCLMRRAWLALLHKHVRGHLSVQCVVVKLHLHKNTTTPNPKPGPYIQPSLT